MKKCLAAVALSAALVQPADATTFPTLTTIYVGAGVKDGRRRSCRRGLFVQLRQCERNHRGHSFSCAQ